MAGAQGTATLDFGAFPGKSDASVAVTGQGAILGTALVEAWIFPAATADHSADEHMLETLKVFAHSIIAGTGFTISGFNTSEIHEPLVPHGIGRDHRAATTLLQNQGFGTATPSIGGNGTRIYGQWNIAWVWNNP